MALTQITTDGIKDGTITGTDLATNVDLADNQKIRFGAGNDLTIESDGTNGLIKNHIGGSIILRANADIQLKTNASDGGADDAIKCVNNGAVELYYDNSKKFETQSDGVYVTGKIQPTGHIYQSDNLKHYWGSSQDLQIYHDGSNSYIAESGTGDLIITSSVIRPRTDQFTLTNAAANEVMMQGLADGAVSLYYDGSKKFETTSYGAQVTGNFDATGSVDSNELTINGTTVLNSSRSLYNLGVLELADNVEARFGSSNDLKIYHDGTDSFILNATGEFQIANSGNGNTIFLQAKAGENSVRALANGAVELYHDNSKRLETTSGGVNIGGNLSSDSGGSFTINAGGASGTAAHFIARCGSENAIVAVPNGAVELYHNNVKQVETNANGILLEDDHRVTFGDSNDGDLRFRSATNALQLTVNNAQPFHLVLGGEDALKAIANGAVELYYDNSKKFETTSTGIDVTGDVDVTDNIRINTNSKRFLAGASNQARMYHDGSDTYFDNTNNGHLYLYNHVSSKSIIFGTAGTNRAGFDSSGHFSPWANNTYDLGTTSERWRNIYTNDLNLSNEGSSNDVDGTWGDWTIQEGESDLFLKNNRSGKKYKFNLTEVA